MKITEVNPEAVDLIEANILDEFSEVKILVVEANILKTHTKVNIKVTIIKVIPTKVTMVYMSWPENQGILFFYISQTFQVNRISFMASHINAVL